MTLRPVPARWFEVIIAREDLLTALEILAKTGEVELEIHSKTTQREIMPDLRDRFETFNRLARRYQSYWPKHYLHPADVTGRPSQRLDSALEKLSIWQQDADSIIEKLESLVSERGELFLLLELLKNMQGGELDFSNLAQAGPVLCARLFVLPVTAQLENLPPSALSIQVTTEQNIFLLVVGQVEAIDALQRDLLLYKGRVVALPNWLKGKLAVASGQVEQRQIEVDRQSKSLSVQLDSITEKHHLSEVLGEIRQLEWFIAHISDLPVSENFAWIAGWTSDISDNRLNQALASKSVRAVVHYPSAPADAKAPMVLQNPWWSRPFELFAKLLGVPSVNEIDPSMFLAIIVPFLFGYMFGDLGQGFVLLIAGILLQQRFPILKLLIGCGLSSMVFGLVFGSVFAKENIIHPLWVNPIQYPLMVLFVPLGGGVVLLLLGLMFNGVQAYWRGQIKDWWVKEAAIIFIYIGVIGSIFVPVISMLIAIGIIWYIAGNLWLAERAYPQALVQVLGQLIESVFQLIINTISFIRVGAFALAHAGLSLALIILINTIANTWLAGIILLIGNVFIIILEGLVVSIQTTRLILFEFFIRFLQGTGRLFHPLTMPSQSAQT
jgi:V/A-type H+-transporting ATPase subunit I